MQFFRAILKAGHPSVPSRDCDTLGGKAIGFPAARWPLCKECGSAMTPLARLTHHPERLDLGAPGRVVFVFQCDKNPGMCETWDKSSGANAVVIVELNELTDLATTPPDPQTPLAPEARVTRWQADDDGVPDKLLPSFFNDDDWMALDDAMVGGIDQGTKLGGPPSWVQFASEAPPAPMRFVAQLAAGYKSEEEDYVEMFNFGDMGAGYLFVDTTSSPPAGMFFWQCS